MAWHPLSEMLWKSDPHVDAARQLPDWGPFHRACAKSMLFFDHIQRDGRRGPYTCDAFTCDRERVPVRLVTGRGATVLEALRDAHDRSGHATAETGGLLARMMGGVGDAGDFDALLTDVGGGGFEELL